MFYLYFDCNGFCINRDCIPAGQLNPSAGTCDPLFNGEDRCGTGSMYDCWCDSLCSTYQDCCHDVTEHCGYDGNPNGALNQYSTCHDGTQICTDTSGSSSFDYFPNFTCEHPLHGTNTWRQDFNFWNILFF